MKFRRSTALYLLVTVIWAATMLALIDKHYGLITPSGNSSAIRRGEAPTGEFWMGIYKGNEKVGYSSNRLTHIGSGYVAEEEAFLRIMVLGEKKDINMSISARLDEAYRLVSFDFDLVADSSVRVEGLFKEGNALEVSIDLAGERSTRTVQLKTAPYLEFFASSLLDDMEVGKTYSIPLIDPVTLSEEVLRMEVEGKERIYITGKDIEAFRVKGTMKGAGLTMWVDRKGDFLKLEDSIGLVHVREDKATAMRMEGEPVDFMSNYAVPFDKKLGANPRYLKIRLKGIDTSRLDLSGGRQHLDGDVLEVNVEPAPEPEPDLSEYLKPSVYIQSEDGAILRLAREITEGKRSTIEKADAVYEWVYRNIEKKVSITLPAASEVLESRRGDCNEHSVLFAALARAAGVPTRIAAGVVYSRGAFYYHAWPEVYYRGWRAMDPTLGQETADASHIRLIAGDVDRFSEMAGILGKLGIEVVEYR